MWKHVKWVVGYFEQTPWWQLEQLTCDKLNNWSETKCEKLVKSLFKCGRRADQSIEEKLIQDPDKEDEADNRGWSLLNHTGTRNLASLVYGCWIGLDWFISSCYVPTCEYSTTPGLSAESQLRDLDMHMKYAHGKHGGWTGQSFIKIGRLLRLILINWDPTTRTCNSCTSPSVTKNLD